MRKLIRSKLMHDAKQYKGKTNQVFHYLWKKEVVERRNAIPIKASNATKAVTKKKKKSMIRRAVSKLFRR